MNSQRHSVVRMAPLETAPCRPRPAPAGADALESRVVLESLVQVPQQLRYLFAMCLGHIRVYEVHGQETHDLVCIRINARRERVSL